MIFSRLSSLLVALRRCHGDQGAQWRKRQQVGVIILDLLPKTIAICLLQKVVAIVDLDVHRRADAQSHGHSQQTQSSCPCRDLLHERATPFGQHLLMPLGLTLKRAPHGAIFLLRVIQALANLFSRSWLSTHVVEYEVHFAARDIVIFISQVLFKDLRACGVHKDLLLFRHVVFSKSHSVALVVLIARVKSQGWQAIQVHNLQLLIESLAVGGVRSEQSQATSGHLSSRAKECPSCPTLWK